MVKQRMKVRPGLEAAFEGARSQGMKLSANSETLPAAYEGDQPCGACRRRLHLAPGRVREGLTYVEIAFERLPDAESLRKLKKLLEKKIDDALPRAETGA